jgi:ADP-ribose pyrophosphatase
MAERKTRSEGGIDAVAVLAILTSTNPSFPLSTIIIEQYRPPVGAYVIGTFHSFDSWSLV